MSLLAQKLNAIGQRVEGAGPSEGVGGSGEEEEVAELRDLFAGARDSPVPVGVYVKYMSSQENRIKANAARKEREERDARRAAATQKQYEQTQARRNAVRTRKYAERKAATERNQIAGREIRAQEKRWAEQRKAAHTELMEEMKVKVTAARGLDARLDAQEAAVDAQERIEATADKQAREKLVAQARRRAAPSPPP